MGNLLDVIPYATTAVRLRARKAPSEIFQFRGWISGVLVLAAARTPTPRFALQQAGHEPVRDALSVGPIIGVLREQAFLVANAQRCQQGPSECH